MIKKKVAIIGAGPTGLAAAYKLVKNNFDVVILEKLPFVGGITATIKHKSMSVDLGPHRFVPHAHEIKKFVFGLLKEKILTKKQQSHIYLWNKFLIYPLNFAEILKNTPPLILMKIGFSYLFFNFSRLFKKKTTISYQDYMRLNFGPFLAENIFCPIAEKTWGEKAFKLSKDLATQRVALESLFKTALNVILGKKSKAYQQQLTPPGFFYYFKGGFGALGETLNKEIKKLGGKTILKAKAKSINLIGNLCTSVTYIKESQSHQLDCDFLITTNPITEIVSMIRPKITEKGIIKAQKNLKYMNLILFYLVLAEQKISDDISMFFPSKRFPFGRIFEQKNFDDSMIPPDKTVLGIEITCKESDKIWQADDKKIALNIGCQLEKMGVIKREEIIDYFSVRIKDVYPVYDLDYKKNLDKILRKIVQVKNLIPNGRLGLFMYNNTHHSLEMGYLAANHIISGKEKLKKWEKNKKIFENYKIVE